MPGADKETVRKLHRGQRRQRLADAQSFLDRAMPKTQKYFADGAEIEPSKIAMRLIPVTSETFDADLFRVATLTWSVPVSPGFGRRMRYLVWDDGHNKLVGIIALGDPVFNLSVRDDLIQWTYQDRSDRLVGILDAYVLGAVPPYNFLLAGKAVACLIRSRNIYDDFTRKYGRSVGVISKSAKRPRLLAVTTTSSMGKSSVYNRLRLDDVRYFESIGFTEGWGHFHITDGLFDKLRLFLRSQNHAYADQHTFGEGPNWRLRTIRAALSELNFNQNVLKHGIKREVFISKLAENAFDVLRTGRGRPNIKGLLKVEEISELAKERWIVPRAERGEVDYKSWRSDMISGLIKGRLEVAKVVAKRSA